MIKCVMSILESTNPLIITDMQSTGFTLSDTMG